MRFNYLEMLKHKGFREPDNMAFFDWQTWADNKDKRSIELYAIVNMAFYNMKFCCFTNEGMLMKLFDTDFFVTISSNRLSGLEKSDPFKRNFIIEIKKDGSILFKQLVKDDELGLILKTFVVEAPTYNSSCYVLIRGYDKCSLDLFQSFLDIHKSTETNILEIFDVFLNNVGLLPDVARKVMLLGNGLQGKSIVEYDEILEHCSIVNQVPLDFLFSSEFQVLESYVRSQLYYQDLNDNQGLSMSYERKLKC